MTKSNSGVICYGLPREHKEFDTRLKPQTYRHDSSINGLAVSVTDCYTEVRRFKADRIRGYLRAKNSFERLPSEGK